MKQILFNTEKQLHEEIVGYKSSWSKENYFESRLRPKMNQFTQVCVNEKNWEIGAKASKSKVLNTKKLIADAAGALANSHNWGKACIEGLVSSYGTSLLPVAGEIILLGDLARDAYYLSWNYVPNEKPVTANPDFKPENNRYLDYLEIGARMYLRLAQQNQKVSNLGRIKCFSEF